VSTTLDVLDLLEIRKSEDSLRNTATLILAQTAKDKLECFKLGCDDFVPLPADDTELFFRICSLLRRSATKGVRGNFGEIGILDLVQMLVAAHRDGVLSIEGSDSAGSLYFSEGHVVHASFGKETGEEAFLSILRAAQKAGTFIFLSENTSQVKKTIDKRTDHLLLGFANQLDEE
jgi:CheY-like chemotaxis protein